MHLAASPSLYSVRSVSLDAEHGLHASSVMLQSFETGKTSALGAGGVTRADCRYARKGSLC